MGSRLEANSVNVRKRIENHTFDDEQGEEYEASTFGGFSDYMRRKKLKLQNLDVELRSQSSHNPPIFRGIVAHVNGYTQPSLNDLHKLIVSYGGAFLQYLEGKTLATHVIASNLTPKKKVEFARYRIVKPAWVVESIKAGKLLPWEGYRVVDEGVTQKILGFDSGRFISQPNSQPRGYREQTDTSWYTSQLRTNAKEDLAPTSVGGGAKDESEHTTPAASGQARSLSDPEPSTVGDASIAATVSSASSTRDSIGSLAEEARIESGVVDTEQGVIASKVEATDEQLFPPKVEGDKTPSHAGSPLIQRQSTSESEEEGQDVAENENSMPSRASASKRSPQETDADPHSPKKRKLTAEEHNARLLSNPHLAKSSTANPDFLNQYYRESRLHHLSTWKADLKAQLQSLANQQTWSQKSLQKRTPGARRYIMHVDFDSFFASVSLRKYPDLIEKPVVIAHGSGPASEIASCNYPARTFGVKNGMWMKHALDLCPDLKTLPYDYKAYEETSRQFYEAIIATDGIVQSVSIDEALVDISDQCIAAGSSDGRGISEGSIYREQAKADQIASDLRALIKEKTGCAVSVGIGNNILLAKVALRKAKPAGQHQIKPDEVLDFIGELVVQDLPGVAHSLGNKLEEIGVKYVKDVRGLTKERLICALGPKTGEKIWDYSRGIDRTQVGEQVVRKSVSAEVNWGIRFVTQQQADEFVQCLCDELSRRLLEQGFKGRQFTMKILRRAADAPLDPAKNLGHGKCDTFNKSVVLGMPTNDKEVLGKEALSVLKGFGFCPGELRGLGVQMQKLEPLKPPGNKLFPTSNESSQRRLQFRQPSSTTSPGAGIPSPPENSKPPAPTALLKKPTRILDPADPIERSPTPEEKSGTEAINGALSSTRTGPSETTYKPLNITGTQFVLPTQIDPSVLAELPVDVRSRLAPKQKRIIGTLAKQQSASPPPSRPRSPFATLSELPNQSQLDPEAVNALPEDVKNELLSFYQTEASRSRSRLQQQQQLLPQSPRKPKPVLASRKLNLTPTKKQKASTHPGRGRPPKTAFQASSASTLTQSNFIASLRHSVNNNKSNHRPETDVVATDDPPTAEAPPDEIAESFLCALPPDLRREILDEHKRERLRHCAGLDISSTSHHRRHQHHQHPSSKNPADWLAAAAAGQRRQVLPARPEIPTFTSRKLSTIEELREAMGAWVAEFSPSAVATDKKRTAEEEEGEEEEEEEDGDKGDKGSGGGSEEAEESGPYDDDVEALGTYLAKVVTVEGNMDKAVSVVRWMAWLVEELKGLNRKRPWFPVLGRLKEVVRDAIRSRGLPGDVDF